MSELNEPILPDDYPVYGNYLYIADGRPVMSDWHDITVKQFANLIGAKEIRRCDIFGRQAMMEAEEQRR